MKNGLISAVKFLPIIVMVGMVLAGYDVLQAAPIAFLTAIIVCRFTEKITIDEIIECGMDSVKNTIIIFFILMMAYTVATLFMSTGVGASIIIIALKLGVTARTIAVVAFIVSSVFSMATGSSWGTFAASIPIFLWLGNICGGDPILIMAACAGGAGFGDNCALISDTTITSCAIQNVKVTDRFTRQILWAISCDVLAAIAFYVAGIVRGLSTAPAEVGDAFSKIPSEVWDALKKERPAAVELLNQVQGGDIPAFMVLPVIIIIVCAIMKMSTMVCMTLGIVTAGVLGGFIGTISSASDFLTQTMSAMADAGKWVLIMVMWVVAFGGIMSKMNAFAPLSKLCLKLSRKVSHLMFWNAILSIGGNMMLSDEQAEIVTIGPVVRELVDNNIEGTGEDLYILRCRNAMFGEGMGVLSGQLIPWHVCSVFYLGLASLVYPLAKFTPIGMLQYNYFAWIIVISLLLLTITGLDRLIPRFGIPKEPTVRLKKNNA